VQSSSAADRTFVVRLVLGEASDDAPAAPGTTRVRLCGRAQKILLADDDPLHLELVQNLLPIEFTVFMPATARPACSCEQCQPDLRDDRPVAARHLRG